ncbi:MAG TPA: DUF952 domain-containing protein [Polyangiaceae bacterium]|nr:DUF952 domain-containing protein [Polyangiaceae bacterium]
MTDFVYKICSRAAFRAAEASGALEPSRDDARDGYIHLSSKTQLAGTLERHFRGERGLVLLRVAPERLPKGALRWEAARDGQLFPHLYGSLPVSAVVHVSDIEDAEPRKLPAEL